MYNVIERKINYAFGIFICYFNTLALYYTTERIDNLINIKYSLFRLSLNLVLTSAINKLFLLKPDSLYKLTLYSINIISKLDMLSGMALVCILKRDIMKLLSFFLKNSLR